MEELNNYVSPKNKKEVIESRVTNLISSASYIFEMIDHNYDDDDAELLKRRLLSSIKNNDVGKFTRSLAKVDRNL